MPESTRQASLSDLSPLQLALLAQEVRGRSEAALRADPIAIIGMGCRLPGNVTQPEEFWKLLCDGVDAVCEVPAGRWDADGSYDPDPAVPGKSATKWGGFLDAIDGFDAAFFGILPREAERMDPQQRLFLEVAIEALDHAGLARERLTGSRTGVFVASYHNDYAHLEYSDPEAIDARTLTGTVHSVLANRLSYLLDLRGPSLSIDTACSSSLVAIHVACQSLRHGESDIALAGGVSLMVSDGLMIALSKVGFMAPDGRCKTFDATADGFGRGEGCSVIVLKRLADAIADGDRVLAVVRGSAVNQDGHSTVLAAPNGLAQQALIREALTNAQLDGSRIGYVEAHGTGTALGDPIEVEALAATVGQPAPGAGTCWMGAAKANIGHLEAAAGVTGVVKSVLVLQHDAIPPQVHFTALNPHISLAGTRLAVPTQLTPWKPGALPRCIGTSGFGVGGTNAHVILEEAPHLGGTESVEWASAPWLLPLSAQSPAALRAVASRWIDFLGTSPVPLPALCATAGERRSHYDHRLAVVAGSVDEMRIRLQAFVDGGHPTGFATGRCPIAAAVRVAFVFSGQGQQWLGMGRELLQCEPVFREALADVDARLRRHVEWSLLDELAAPEARSRLDDTEVAQPAIFAVQFALVALWASWGIRPDGVVGHSIGDITALQVAGILSLEEAVRIVVQRARAMQRATGRGLMAAVGLTEAEAGERLRTLGKSLSIAAVNGPRSVVLSGDSAALADVLQSLEAAGVSQRRLPVNYAFHSAQMQPFADELVAALGQVDCGLARLPVYSTVEGRALGDQRLDVHYFGRNVRETVRFASAIAAMIDDGFTAFVEIAAHPVLAGSIADCSAGHEHVAAPLASLRRARSERETLLLACAGLYAIGRMPEWQGLQRAPANVIDLPQYPWQRERYWLRERPAGAIAHTQPVAGDDGLLGRRVPTALATVFESSWPAAAPAWLSEHRIGGRLLMPGMAMLEALRMAATQVLGEPRVELIDLVLHHTLVLDEQSDGAVAPGSTWQVVVPALAHAAVADAPIELSLHQVTTWKDGVPSQWRKVASARAHRAPACITAGSGEVQGSDAADTATPIDTSLLYDEFARIGADFGPSFRTITHLSLRPGGATAWLQRSSSIAACPDEPTAGVHPTVLDGALQACLAAIGQGSPQALYLPFAVDRFEVCGPVPERLRAELRWTSEPANAGSLAFEIALWSAEGSLVARLEDVRCMPPPSGLSMRADPWLHEVRWSPVPDTPATAATSGAWLLLCDASGVGDALAAALEARGQPCLRVHAAADPQRSGPHHVTVDPTRVESLERLLADTRWRKGQPLAGIVHLWSLDIATTAWSVEDAQARCRTEDIHGAISALTAVQAAARSGVSGTAAPQMVFVTSGAQPAGSAVSRVAAAGLWGLSSVVAVEHPELAVRVIDMDSDLTSVDVTAVAAELQRGASAPRRLALRGAKRQIPRFRHRPMPSASGGHQLALGATPTLDALHWGPLSLPPPGSAEVRVRVVAAGVNFRDVLMALGMIPHESAFFGAECAGVVTAVGAGVDDLQPGDEVFGFAPHSLASEANVPAAFLVRWPAELGSLELAASLPAVYLTAMLGLERHASLKAGQRVLIHAAAGGVGLAALRLAQRAGAEVFATAGSPAKRALLQSLGVRHVYDSRSLDFATQIHAATGGAGVDVVLNSLAGDFIAASVESLAAEGCFLELGKRDVWSDERFHRVRPRARYRVYDLGQSAAADPAIVRPMLQALIAGLRARSLGPLPLRVFDFVEVGDAFRLMAQARHIGKLVLRAPVPAPDGASVRPLVRPEASYWITGGLGALGLHTARWLAQQGARYLVLTSRRTPDATAREVVSALEAQGVTVLVRQADVGDAEQARAVFDEITRTLPPLRGVIHAAGTVDDGVLLQQDPARFEGVLRGKAQGARILDVLTRAVALDFFVMYSAVGLLLGPAGQGPYAAANAELDALAFARRAAGLPALSVAWGLWREGGMAATLESAGKNPWVSRGLGWIESVQGFARLERLMREGAVHAAVLPIDWPSFLARLPEGVDPDFFRDLADGPAAAAVGKPNADGTGSKLGQAAVWRSLPESQRRAAVVAHVADQTLQVLGLPATTQLDPRTPLREAGLDSLMAVELRNALTRSIGQALPATLLFDYPSVDAVTNYLLRTLKLVQDESGSRSDSSDAVQQVRAEIVGLSDAEAEAQLLAELDNSAPRARP
ncbi:MAG: SDR family NAD(P)-dependent oxidoreductase [Sinobacteraceae bacterium]|nr:SDR family NAD(P)-dependent oxidoreductase [Pseudomonadales bacterium]MCP5327335.1 SDR family NAD(P)-dependent oxidoreductase [Nevskiaceae bacterium]MCP5340487.1 SDR family NAD(P)-dependent oxidoreductase [Nevskiaceae bacterium]MCP5470743.1 SDR family NAD(P)-dependent oxidoreductase [Nevskiaceae bacterium]